MLEWTAAEFRQRVTLSVPTGPPSRLRAAPWAYAPPLSDSRVSTFPARARLLASRASEWNSEVSLSRLAVKPSQPSGRAN